MVLRSNLQLITRAVIFIFLYKSWHLPIIKIIFLNKVGGVNQISWDCFAAIQITRTAAHAKKACPVSRLTCSFMWVAKLTTMLLLLLLLLLQLLLFSQLNLKLNYSRCFSSHRMEVYLWPKNMGLMDIKSIQIIASQYFANQAFKSAYFIININFFSLIFVFFKFIQ